MGENSFEDQERPGGVNDIMASDISTIKGDYITFDLKGFKEIDELLKTLPKNLQKEAIRKSMNKAAQIVVVEAKKRVPIWPHPHRYKGVSYPPGFLKKNIAWGVGTKNKGIYVTTRIVGIKKSKGKGYYPYYARMVELGHKSRAGRDVQPQPFMQPALTMNVQKITNTLRVQLLEQLNKLGVYK